MEGAPARPLLDAPPRYAPEWDFATPLPLWLASGHEAERAAHVLAGEVRAVPLVEDAVGVPPGFVNLRLSDEGVRGVFADLRRWRVAFGAPVDPPPAVRRLRWRCDALRRLLERERPEVVPGWDGARRMDRRLLRALESVPSTIRLALGAGRGGPVVRLAESLSRMGADLYERERLPRGTSAQVGAAVALLEALADGAEVCVLAASRLQRLQSG